MSFCSNCGNKVSETTKFCSNCGNKIERGEFIIPPELPNNLQSKHQSKSSFKNLGYVKYVVLAVIVLAVVSFYYIGIGSGKNKYDSDGNKHGEWVEYINEDGSQEVSKESAKFIRHITYYHGLPGLLEVVKDFYPNGNIQSEFQLTSGPYNKNQIRPADQYINYSVFFDEQTSKIKAFAYYDENGESDPEKTVTKAFEIAVKDSRYDEEFLAKTKFGEAVLRCVRSMRQNNFGNSSNNNDEMPPTGSDNDFGNSSNGYNNQFSKSSSNSQRKCSDCKGTGRCSACNKVFSMSYYNESGGGWENRNETRPGYIRCESCFGRGYRGGGRDIVGNPKPKEKCYCINGWKYCPECNPSGNGNKLGVCKECNGTGLSKYQY